MIKLSPQSERYVQNVFSKYSQVEELPDILTGRTILHIYPVADTITEFGDLEGFEDALFVNVHVYMCESETFFIIESRNEIELKIPSRVRIFKDSSTMIIIDQDIKIGMWKSLQINPAYNNGINPTAQPRLYPQG